MSVAVGLIGVGLMGQGIGWNIVSKGWPLAYLRHPGNQPTEELDARGATGKDDTAALVAASEILVLCVTGSAQVEDVLTGSGAVLARLRPGMVVIDCSTAMPESTRALAAKVTAAGAHFVDAAMTRTPKEAREGRLNLLVGGDAAAIARVRPLLETFAENIFPAGPVGAGHQMKLLHNYVSLGMASLLAEAGAAAAAGGLDPRAFVDCLRKGGGYGAALDRLGPFMTDGEMAQFRFSIANATKDMTYYTAMAETAGTARPIAEAVRGSLQALVDGGHGDELMPQMIRLLQRTA